MLKLCSTHVQTSTNVPHRFQMTRYDPGMLRHVKSCSKQVPYRSNMFQKYPDRYQTYSDKFQTYPHLYRHYHINSIHVPNIHTCHNMSQTCCRHVQIDSGHVPDMWQARQALMHPHISKQIKRYLFCLRHV